MPDETTIPAHRAPAADPARGGRHVTPAPAKATAPATAPAPDGASEPAAAPVKNRKAEG